MEKNNQLQDISRQKREQLREGLIPGPRFYLSRSSLSIITSCGNIGQDSIQVINVGTTSLRLTFINRNCQQISSALKPDDGVQRFYMPLDQLLLKPGDMKTIVVSFRSEKTGTFSYEWEVQSDPPCPESSRNLKAVGIATSAKSDKNVCHRNAENIRKKGDSKFFDEIIDDLLE